MTKQSTILPIDLKTENLTNPLGINGVSPEFSWCISPDSVPHEQSAWRIRASKDASFSADVPLLWDSGKIQGHVCAGHRYGGPALQSRDRIYWQVKLWDEIGRESPWSPSAFFETGLLTLKDWDIQWIGFPGGWSGHAVYFQHYFEVPSEYRMARVYLGGPAWSESWLNGVRLGGNAVLQPAQSDYSKSWHYLTYDVTELLRPGENVFAVHAGAGWYGTPVVCYRIEANRQLLVRSHYLSLPYAWRSPVFRNSIYGGEEYDARQEVASSWTLPGGVKLPCQRAAFRVSGLAGEPRGLEEEPIAPQEEISPVHIVPLSNGRYSVDFGRNFAGWCRLKIHAPAGTRVELIFSETRYSDGTANQENLLGDHAVDVYIAKGSPGYEVYEPHFTYHGFRYVEVRGLPTVPESDTLTGIVLRSGCRPTGSFSCDNELVNRIFEMIRRTEESNLHAVPTDCPQRTERMGWLNDMMARCESSLYLFDESNLQSKWLCDIAEAQNQETGDIPMTAPLHWGFEIDPVCSSFLESAWLNYAFYGKRSQLERWYPNFCHWVDCLLNSRDSDGILRKGGWVGDWVPPLKFNLGHDSPRNFTVPHELVATALVHYALLLLERIAGIIGKDTSDILINREQIREDFLRIFRSGPGRLKRESQSAYAYAVYCDLFSEEEKPLAAAHLAELFQENACKHTTGNIGTRYLLETLSRYGYGNLVWRLVSSSDYPGWGYMLANGATTLWERWELATGTGMNSHNHPMLGCPCAWLFRYPAGIRVLPDTAGFDHFELAPLFLNELGHVEADYKSRAGMVRSHWKRNGSLVEYRFEIPAGCRAMVRIPHCKPQEYRGGKHFLVFAL